MQQNLPSLRFEDARLAAAFGKSCVETRLAQTSASWLSGDSFQRQTIDASNCPKLRPASANQPRWPRQPAGWPYRACFHPIGKSAAEFDAMPVSRVAIDVVFDALAQSKSSLLKRELADQRKLSWLTAEVTLTLSPTLNAHHSPLTFHPNPHPHPNSSPTVALTLTLSLTLTRAASTRVPWRTGLYKCARWAAASASPCCSSWARVTPNPTLTVRGGEP